MRNSIAIRLAAMSAAAALVAFALLGGALHRVRRASWRATSRHRSMAGWRTWPTCSSMGVPSASAIASATSSTMLGAADPRTRSWLASDDPAFR